MLGSGGGCGAGVTRERRNQGPLAGPAPGLLVCEVGPLTPGGGPSPPVGWDRPWQGLWRPISGPSAGCCWAGGAPLALSLLSTNEP